ncbi:MAG: hypothetical protein R3C46_13555 [Hyphomonadaceae bacterium]
MMDELPQPLSTFALAASWLTPANLLTVWRCAACDEPHTCDVERSRDGTYSYLCLHNGRLPLSRSELQTYALDWDATLGAFAESIGRNERDVSRYASERLFKIGYIDRGMPNDGWTLGLAVGLDDAATLSAVLHVLRTSFPKGSGLIATIGARPPGEVRIEGYLFVDASKLFRLQSNKLALMQLEASKILFGPGPAPAKSGAKSRSANIAQIRKALLEAGEWPDRRNAQVKSIRSGWKKSMGKMPAVTSVPRNLREIEEAEREGREIT